MQRRSNRSEPLVHLTNEQLGQVERINRATRARRRLPLMDDNHANGQPDPVAQQAVLQQQIQLMQQQMEQLMAQQAQEQARAAIGDNDTPHTFYQNRAAICPPEPARQDFEIKPQMIALVKQHLFHGLPAENPMDHIENFEEICSTTKSNGVPPDYLKCKLFSHSLADKAQRWLKSLPPKSLTTWDQVRATFLNHFYTKSKTASLRNKITTFGQQSGESFGEAWERMKEYRRECPHHGYSDEQILNIFYDGVSWNYRTALNSASNGDFMTQSIEGAYKLIENMAASSNSRSVEYDRSGKVNRVEIPSAQEIAEQVSRLMQTKQRSVNLCESGSEAIQYQEDAEAEAERFREVNYINGHGFGQNRGFNSNYASHPNLSYRSTNVANPQDQVYPPQMAAQ